MKRIFSVCGLSILLLFIASGTTCQVRKKSESYEWKNVRMVGGGFVPGYIFHPKEKNLLYARTDMGGAYRWEESSKEWIPLLDWVSYEDYNLLGVESLGLDPNDPDRLYLACGTYTDDKTPNGAILVSLDRGKTFKRVNVPFKMGGNENGRGNGERLAVDPNDGNIIYLGTRLNGLWKSIDKGMSWNQVKSFPNIVDTTSTLTPWGSKYVLSSGIVFVLFDGASGKIGEKTKNIYVGVALMGRENMFCSHDGGETWKPVPGHPQQYRALKGVMAADGNMYVAYGNSTGPMPMVDGGIWRFNTKTGEWFDISPDKPDNQYKFGYAAVAVDAQKPGTLIASSFYRFHKGGDEIFLSRDYGKNWIPVFASGSKFDYSLAPYIKHTPVHWLFDLEIDPFNSNHVLFSTGYGGHQCYNFEKLGSTDSLVWEIAATGIEETVALDLHSPNKGPQLYTAIGDYCGFAHEDLDSFVPSGCYENPHFGNTDAITSAESKPEMVVRVGRPSYHVKGIGIGYSLDYGKTWKPCESLPNSKSQLGFIALACDGSSWIWTPEREKAYYTDNMGKTWHLIADLPPYTRVVADRINPKKFYAISLFDGILYSSQDGGKSFKPSKLNLPDGIPQRGFRGDIRGGQDRIYTMPGKEGNLWLAAYHGLYFSNNSGKNWKRMPLVSEMHGFGFGKAAPNSNIPALYMIGVVDHVRGIFRSDDGAKSWIRINDDMHQWGLLLHITGDPKKYGRVYVGTHGRGTQYGDIKISTKP
jgi:photosystem II stability/assembly factor-like uncharacterized protein